MPIEIAQTTTPQEAAAIAAAIQRFSQDTAIAPPAEPTGMDPWLKAALEEGVSAKETFGPGQPFGVN
ncbi:MAG: hypothetical protein KDB54_00180 [Solirubrobacterales bacterium]|nr:hypothetical protein [Solirubrobacterales bacterium]MCB0859054.1 hypothetical protein [Solirubrobacterales bacterium]